MTIGIAVTALVVAVAAALISYWAKGEATRSANAAEAADRRERTPKLVISLTSPAPFGSDKAIYTVRNDGPQDLDSVVIHRPVARDNIVYSVTPTGIGRGFGDVADLGPMPLAERVKFTMACGPADELPEFLVRVEARAGRDEWTVNQLLADPRGAAELWAEVC
jgi:hypothetical protein